MAAHLEGKSSNTLPTMAAGILKNKAAGPPTTQRPGWTQLRACSVNLRPQDLPLELENDYTHHTACCNFSNADVFLNAKRQFYY
jgi:hypothetical protein